MTPSSAKPATTGQPAPPSASTRVSSARPPVHHRRTRCRACDGSDLRRFLDLGSQPLANAFLRDAADFPAEQRFPLEVYFCADCSLVQLLDVIDPEVLFGHYVYVTGTSDTIAEHNQRYARAVVDELDLDAGDLVIEIASNDGSLLSCFAALGVRTLGVEPARNIAAIARERGIETVSRFFTAAAARDLLASHGPARAIVGNNVLAHVDDTRDFLAGCAHLLAPDGRVIVEVPYALDMLERREYDTIYHEHLCYFGVSSLQRLGQGVGLSLVRVDRVSVHGGSIRAWFAKDAPAGTQPASLIAAEQAAGVTSFDAWSAFAVDAGENRRSLRSLLEGLGTEGKQIAGYGAPAKGNTLLNYCGIDTALLPYTVDRNPLKVGSFTPGMHLPVLPVPTLLERQPDAVLILAWNFADEIVRQQQEYASRGGRFILPIPSPRIL